MLIVSLTAFFAKLSHADGVCGDLAVDAPEQCDDGNLSNGDGCSLSCRLERCGNGTIDGFEQCDDGNAVSGDGCTVSCQIEFCGDGSVQAGIFEQCDDGNGVSGDGCTAACKLEGHLAAPVIASSASPESAVQPQSESAPQSTGPESAVASTEQTSFSDTENVAPAVTSPAQAAVAEKFLESPASESLRSTLGAEHVNQLTDILHALSQGQKLTDEQRATAASLGGQLVEAREAERARATDLLKQFIETPISADVVTGKNIDSGRLVNVSIPMAIGELEQAIEIIRGGQLQEQVQSDAALLARFGINLGENLPSDYASMLSQDSHPIDIFSTLKTLKESAEKHATPDLAASLLKIQTETEALQKALPILVREYGLNADEAGKMLGEIATLSQEVTKQDSDRLVGAVSRFTGFLERRDVLSTADKIATTESLHPAAAAQRIAAEAGDPVIHSDVRSFVIAMAAKAPDAYKDAFETGSMEDQRSALLDFLGNDERIPVLLDLLKKDGVTDFDARLETLRKQITFVGGNVDTETPCDDSMPSALQCTTDFLADLQDAVRNRNLFTKIVGSLQDFFFVKQ